MSAKSFRWLIPVLALSVMLASVHAADTVTVVHAEGTADEATAALAKYQLVPKGVVLEGTAEGIEPITTLSYNREKDEFLINGKMTYKNPVSRKEFVQLFKSLRKDDALGVTLLNGSTRVYGSVSAGSEMMEALSATDRLLGGIIYGFDHLLGDAKLPGNYKPRKTENRKVPVVAFSNFTYFTFEKVGESYKCVNCTLDIKLIPMADKKTSSGGHLPDTEKLKEFVMEENDSANIDHIRTHQAEYFKIPFVAKTVATGEAAAFARTVRDSKVDPEELLKQMK
ncbi:MAG TPA: hypothetical protein VEK08_09525 [Planctomycetota bacterium]|nr:hypothetical protein [Planctomycetota bacterium]